MRKIFLFSLTVFLSIFLFTGCATEQNANDAVAPTAVKESQNNSSSNRTTEDSSEVVCQNCRAKFKLSYKIQKLVKNGYAEVECPVCHKNYITGNVVKHH